MYDELGVFTARRIKPYKEIAICSARGELIMYLGTFPARLSVPITEENPVTPARPRSSPASNGPLTVDRLILPRPGTLVKNGRAADDIYVVIKKTALVERQAELIITSSSTKPVNLTINDHYMKYTYRDERFPANLAAISLPPVPLSNGKFVLSSTILARSMVMCWPERCSRFMIDDNAGPLRDFATSVAEALKIDRLDVRKIFLRYSNSAWYINVGSVDMAMKYSDVDSVGPEEVVNETRGTVRSSSKEHDDGSLPKRQKTRK
ncbi:hypothetical protein FOZ63_025638 [Perkinsus olseni]|uniref:Uncharacterized protein n=1 Tax=Perkinsus olseni TaxID=32597 RepID=A0A7J6RWX0_PEROL|nr:hypothetical protein FOZ63_025638 [Perkinsus olseni]KAF4746013.1 hypothetical protein FOZ62_029697 [Perkinsus olseni]